MIERVFVHLSNNAFFFYSSAYCALIFSHFRCSTLRYGEYVAWRLSSSYSDSMEFSESPDIQPVVQMKEEIMTHPVDVHVGKRIRHRRWLVGMTQQQLAEHVGIKFQQIQKYETGANRVSASRLWDIADALDVPISFFFEGLDQGGADKPENEQMPADLMGDKEALDLVRSYYSIPENQRRRLFDLARVLSDVA